MFTIRCFKCEELSKTKNLLTFQGKVYCDKCFHVGYSGPLPGAAGAILTKTAIEQILSEQDKKPKPKPPDKFEDVVWGGLTADKGPCECGAEALKSPKHSDWCPRYEKV